MADRDETPTPTDTRVPARDEVLEGHRALMPVVHALAECADRSPGTEKVWLTSVLDRLGELRAALVEHFSEEEEGPFATDFTAAFPHLSGRVSDLLEEHAGILESVDGALASARAAAPDDLPAQHEIKAALHLLLATIRRHEGAENDLVSEAWSCDLGGGD